MMRHADARDQVQDVFLAQQRTFEDEGAGDLDGIVHQHQDEIVRRGDILGQALGDGDADRHFDVPGQAAQNLPHQGAFALIEAGALDAVKRGDGEVDFLAARAP